MKGYTVIINNVLTKEKKIKTINENQLDDSILDAFGVSAQSDFLNVYLNDRNYMTYEKMPYVLVDEKIMWDIPFSCITVKQFIDTYNITDRTINIRTGFPAASGADWITFKEMWDIFFNDILPMLGDICSVVGACGVVKAAFDNIRKKAKNDQGKDIAPDYVIDTIYRKNTWNIHKLSEELDDEGDKVEDILIMLGYVQSESNGMYVITEEEKNRRINIIRKGLIEIKINRGYSR